MKTNLDFRLFFGPMSKNIVDTIINYSNNTNIKFGIIPSRRQVDFDGGYVHNFRTDTFVNYIKNKTKNILIERDHGGPLQGCNIDSGLKSLEIDSLLFDIIHIDPWKLDKDIYSSAELSLFLMNFCYSINENIKFEIGTEESIRKYNPEELDLFLSYIKNRSDKIFSRIEFVVIQSGTITFEDKNIGIFDEKRFDDFLSICKKYLLKSKEHNGDYISNLSIKKRLENGLDAINIAPELGAIESKTIIDFLIENNLNNILSEFLEISYKSNKWKKWFKIGSNPSMMKVAENYGHYIFSNEEWLSLITKYEDELNLLIHQNISKFLESKIKECFDDR